MAKMNILKQIYERLKNPPAFKSIVQREEVSKLTKKFGLSSKILNIGSKETAFSNQFINLDVIKYPNLDIIADAHNLPFRDQTMDGVVITAVLEIVRNPEKVVCEIYRILKKNGEVIATLPFLQPYHPDPTDYQRFTIEGVENLFSRFEKLKLINTKGLFSMFIWILREFLSTLFSFNNDTLWKLNNIIFGWLLYPFNYIDYCLPKYERLYSISSSFLYLGKKK